MNEALVSRAMMVAEREHRGQVRKYTLVPYILHPAEVVGILRAFPVTSEQLAAAWLHDVVEDTDMPQDCINAIFGLEVGNMVALLTNTETGNRAKRRQLEIERLSRASGSVQTIKYADLISNTHDITTHDPDFATVYLAEKRRLLEAMQHGDDDLRRLAFQVLIAAERSLVCGCKPPCIKPEDHNR